MFRISKKGASIFGIILIACVVLLFSHVLPIVNRVRTDLKAYDTRVAHRDNYKLHTTPLSEDVVNDICSKLEIKESSENCKPDAVVYAPDFFDEIKAYFNSLPDGDKTYSTVQDRLGKYLVSCDKTTSDGHYSCRYDIRGDKVYRVAFFFDEKDFYFRIIANIGGS